MGWESRQKKNYESIIRGQYQVGLSVWFENDDQNISTTNFWESEIAFNGHFYVSVNAGAIRLLLPRNMEKYIGEIETATYVILSFTEDEFELVFEDFSDTPFFLNAPSVFIDRSSSKSRIEGLSFSVWTQGCVKVMEMEAKVREVNRIPCLARW